MNSWECAGSNKRASETTVRSDTERKGRCQVCGLSLRLTPAGKVRAHLQAAA